MSEQQKQAPTAETTISDDAVVTEDAPGATIPYVPVGVQTTDAVVVPDSKAAAAEQEASSEQADSQDGAPAGADTTQEPGEDAGKDAQPEGGPDQESIGEGDATAAGPASKKLSHRQRNRRLVRKLAAKDEIIAQQQRELDELKAQRGGGDQASTDNGSSELQKPRMDDYESADEYYEAQAEYVYQREEQKKLRASQDTQEPSAEGGTIDPRLAAELKAVAKDGNERFGEGFTTRLQAEDLPLSEAVLRAAINSDDPDGVLNEITQSPELALELAMSDERELYRRIGQIEAQVSAGGDTDTNSGSASEEPARHTNAPAPPEPVDQNSGGGPAVVRNDDLPMDDYFAKRRREEAARNY